MRAFFRKNAHIVSLLPVLGLMLMIFYFSAQPAAQSDRTSGGIVELLLRLLYPSFAGLEASRQHTLASAAAHIVRKCAHFGEYAALGMALLWHLRAWQIRHPIPRPACWAFAAGALYAASDELHQLFVPGRSGELTDVLLDGAGLVAGILLIQLLTRRNNNRDSKKSR